MWNELMVQFLFYLLLLIAFHCVLYSKCLRVDLKTSKITSVTFNLRFMFTNVAFWDGVSQWIKSVISAECLCSWQFVFLGILHILYVLWSPWNFDFLNKLKMQLCSSKQMNNVEKGNNRQIKSKRDFVLNAFVFALYEPLVCISIPTWLWNMKINANTIRNTPRPK